LRMKKVALLLAAAMLALAGCASAGDTAAASEAAPAESTAESAAAEDSTEAALPGEPHPLSAYSACAVSGNCVYAAVTHFSSSEDSLGSFDHSTVYKTDLTTGQTYEMYRTDSQLASAPLIIDDTLYFICYDGGMLALPTTGGEARVLPFSYDDWMPVFYAGHYLYCRSVSAAPFCRTDGMRFNLENGETAPWNIPVETMYIPDVVGDALLLCRVVSDYPVPYPDDDEMSQALLQNTTLEYTLADPATGAVRQTCFTLPYDIPQPGSLTIYTYLGKCGSDFYFRADQCDDEYAFVSQSVLRIGTDGTRTDLGITKTPDYLDYCAEIEVTAALTKVGVDRKAPRLRYVIGEGKAGLPHRACRGVGQGVFQCGVLQKRLGHLVVVRVGHRIIRDNAAEQQRVPDDIGNVHCLHRDIPRRGLPVFQVKPHTVGTAERRGADAPAVEVVTCVKNRHPVVVGERQHARLTARRRQGQHTAVVADEIQRVVYDQRRGRKLGVRAVHLIGLPGGKVGFVDGAVIKAAETVLAA
jgi:hypothetical protein